jgi:hypothetical protein
MMEIRYIENKTLIKCQNACADDKGSENLEMGKTV